MTTTERAELEEALDHAVARRRGAQAQWAPARWGLDVEAQGGPDHPVALWTLQSERKAAQELMSSIRAEEAAQAELDALVRTESERAAEHRAAALAAEAEAEARWSAGWAEPLPELQDGTLRGEP